jgi:hypothetical protein
LSSNRIHRAFRHRTWHAAREFALRISGKRHQFRPLVNCRKTCRIGRKINDMMLCTGTAEEWLSYNEGKPV